MKKTQFLCTLSRAKSLSRSISKIGESNFSESSLSRSITKIWESNFFSVEPPKTQYFIRNYFSLRFREKSSQIKTFSRKVFFMFCLDHFSLNCIIKMSNLKVNDSLQGHYKNTSASSVEITRSIILFGLFLA